MKEMFTRWTDLVDESCPLPEYPRPQLVRNDWQNLNGRYDFTVRKIGEPAPENYESEIIVPFTPESFLSGVGRTVEPDDCLWYRRYFTLNESYKNKRILLHFEAVDHHAAVFINGTHVGEHIGGYLPFSFDITDLLIPGENELVVSVTDPTDAGNQDRGKQVRRSKGFWYTATSGIWQTVWLEPVGDIYIKELVFTPDIDSSRIGIKTVCEGNALIKAIIKDGDDVVFAGNIEPEAGITVKNMKTWSPEDPFLYDIAVALCREDGSILDVVTSYFGMRKFNVGYDDSAVPRLFLNNRPYFQNGLLDQGYWPDGGMTPPTDEAMIFDIESAKELGFNMLRKHIKIEPRRWYYHCDRLGMIVWQDMVCGADNINMFLVGLLPNIGVIKVKDDNHKLFGVSSQRCRELHERAVFETVDTLRSCPCISCWVIFNEGWGQFDAARIADEVKRYDPTRIVDHASGWHDQGGQELKSVHRYIVPVTMPKADGRPFVLSEFGGYSRIIENHVWNRKRSFGYVMFKTKSDLTAAYERLFLKQIIPKIKKGLSATVYTQVSDVEFEVNGLFTYDREMLKIDADTIKRINSQMRL